MKAHSDSNKDFFRKSQGIHSARDLEGKYMTRDQDDKSNETLMLLIEDASRQVGFQDHIPAGYTEPTVRIRKPAASMARLNILCERMPSIKGQTDEILHAAVRIESGEVISLSAAAARYSRALSAGAHLIVLPEETASVGTGKLGAIGMVQRPGGLRLIEPASLDVIDLDPITGEGEVSVSPLNMPEASILRDSLTQRAVRFSVKRREARKRPEGLLEAEIMTAIALGLGRAFDAELLPAIAATTPGAFSIGAAAELGIAWEELRAIVGTAGTAATTDQGKIYAHGVSAALCPEISGTIIGAFDRAAVVVHDKIEIMAERRNAAGDLVITAWVGMGYLLPSSAYFWAGA